MSVENEEEKKCTTQTGRRRGQKENTRTFGFQMFAYYRSQSYPAYQYVVMGLDGIRSRSVPESVRV